MHVCSPVLLPPLHPHQGSVHELGCWRHSNTLPEGDLLQQVMVAGLLAADRPAVECLLPLRQGILWSGSPCSHMLAPQARQNWCFTSTHPHIACPLRQNAAPHTLFPHTCILLSCCSTGPMLPASLSGSSTSRGDRDSGLARHTPTTCSTVSTELVCAGCSLSCLAKMVAWGSGLRKQQH
jgi:hypothetical protein